MAERKAKGEAKQKEAAARLREAENSFESVARECWKWWLIGKSPRHADTTMRRLEADVFPACGHKSINEVTAADVRLLMIAVEKRDARDVAKRIHETTSQIFRFAIARDIAIRNPAADLKPRDILAEAQTENRARVDSKELPELLVKIDTYNGDAITRLAIEFMTDTRSPVSSVAPASRCRTLTPCAQTSKPFRKRQGRNAPPCDSASPLVRLASRSSFHSPASVLRHGIRAAPPPQTWRSVSPLVPKDCPIPTLQPRYPETIFRAIQASARRPRTEAKFLPLDSSLGLPTSK